MVTTSTRKATATNQNRCFSAVPNMPAKKSRIPFTVRSLTRLDRGLERFPPELLFNMKGARIGMMVTETM